MRLDTLVDDEMMLKAMQVTGLRTQQAVIEEALRLLILSKNSRILGLHAGKIQMSEDFNEPLPDEFWLGQS